MFEILYYKCGASHPLGKTTIDPDSASCARPQSQKSAITKPSQVSLTYSTGHIIPRSAMCDALLFPVRIAALMWNVRVLLFMRVLGTATLRGFGGL
jgi:hypothetical protein